MTHLLFSSFFFFNDTATTEIYTLSLHDALPILRAGRIRLHQRRNDRGNRAAPGPEQRAGRRNFGVLLDARSEEHTSELQSRFDLVCRLLLEKKKIKKYHIHYPYTDAKKRKNI